MKKFKRILRYLLLFCLIILATVGIGMIGGIPLPVTERRKQTEIKIEMIDDQKEKTDVKEIESKR